MYEARMERILEKMKAYNADVFVLANMESSDVASTRYLSGFSGTTSILFITLKERKIFTDARYFGRVESETPEFDLVRVERGRFFRPIEDLIKNLSQKVVLIDSSSTLYDTVSRLKKFGLEIVGVPRLMHEIRMQKFPEELEFLEKSFTIAVRAFGRLIPKIHEGVSEKHLAAFLEFFAKEEGADAMSFKTIIASGVRGAVPHAETSEQKLKQGELVTIDFGVYYQGYASDITRTLAIGNVSEQLKEMYEVVRNAQEAGCEKAKAGILGSELDDVCRKIIAEAGYGKYFLHGTGHGIGLEVHEFPYVSSSWKKELPENSVVSCEPGIYISGVGGVRIEDGLVLGKNGNMNLSEKLPKELLVL